MVTVGGTGGASSRSGYGRCSQTPARRLSRRERILFILVSTLLITGLMVLFAEVFSSRSTEAGSGSDSNMRVGPGPCISRETEPGFHAQDQRV